MGIAMLAVAAGDFEVCSMISVAGASFHGGRQVEASPDATDGHQQPDIADLGVQVSTDGEGNELLNEAVDTERRHIARIVLMRCQVRRTQRKLEVVNVPELLADCHWAADRLDFTSRWSFKSKRARNTVDELKARWALRHISPPPEVDEALDCIEQLVRIHAVADRYEASQLLFDWLFQQWSAFVQVVLLSMEAVAFSGACHMSHGRFSFAAIVWTSPVCQSARVWPCCAVRNHEVLRDAPLDVPLGIVLCVQTSLNMLLVVK